MKLQGLSIIFALIVIPIILISTYYIQLQVDTITLQTSYDSKLLDATHGAMVAFELNTANEELSSVADSLRTIIDASNNVFIDTLATNMGLSNASKSYIEPYIPAVLYTLYDGYYINSPTKTPEIAVDSSGVALEINAKGDDPNKFSMPGLKYNGTEYEYNSEDTNYYNLNSVPSIDFGGLLYKKNNGKYTADINNEDISYSTDHVLKSYMPYSARYVRNQKDITINYTLDNFMTIVATIDGVNYTKSGYLIKSDLVEITSKGFMGRDQSIFEFIQGRNINDVETMIKDIFNSGETVKLTLKETDGTEIKIETNDINSDEASAIIYYAKAKIFSDWVYSNFDDIEEKDIVENLSNEIIGTTTKQIEQVIYSFEDKNNKIFDKTQNPEDDKSTFVNHKYQVIRNSIQYNLNLAMSIYNEKTTSSYDFNMPVISEDEWEKIISHVSVVSFMQGLECGLKIYNNYAIVYSTNNEIFVEKDEIYFVRTYNDALNSWGEFYHRIDCPRFDAEGKITSFTSKEVKYDQVYNKETKEYSYDHKSLACYTCIVDGNYEPEPLDDKRKKAKAVALAKERNNLYKMNAIKYSEGYRIIYDKQELNPSLNSGTLRVDKFDEIKEFIITFGHIPSVDSQQTTVAIEFNRMFSKFFSDKEYVLNTNQSKEQTLIVKKDIFTSGTTIDANKIKDTIELSHGTGAVDVQVVKDAIISIKAVYE